jgi:hypothetical protein
LVHEGRAQPSASPWNGAGPISLDLVILCATGTDAAYNLLEQLGSSFQVISDRVRNSSAVSWVVSMNETVSGSKRTPPGTFNHFVNTWHCG